MKRVIVTGASGFIGYHLVNELQKNNIFVYAIVRPNSKNKVRLDNFKNIEIIELAMQDIRQLTEFIQEKCDMFYHLACEGGRDDFFAQNRNIGYTLDSLEVAKKVGCKRFIATGSQAEYGLCNGLITEETLPTPNTAYGAAKLAANYLSKIRAEQIEMEWIWVRIFSIYGQYDNPNCLIPYLIRSLKNGEMPELTKGMQNWDYLNVSDAAQILMLLGDKGYSGEIYHLASGDVHPLKYFMEKIKEKIVSKKELAYGSQSRMIVSLQPSIKKLQRHTGWNYKNNFSEKIDDIIKNEWY